MESEAERLVDLLRQLWPSKFHWTQGMTGLWVERLNRPDLNADQCAAVIRQCRTEDESPKPSMKRVMSRCHEAHKTSRPARNTGQLAPVAGADLAECRRDRESAAAWWQDNKHDRERIVADAVAAFPMFAKSFTKFLAEDYHPTPHACMVLRIGWNEYADKGARPKPAWAPGIMAGMVTP